MDIQHKQEDSKGFFIIEKGGETVAELGYLKTDDTKMIIDHTEVSEELRGKKIGKKLVEHAVNYARENNFKVTPHCPYAKSVIERDDSLRDVLQ